MYLYICLIFCLSAVFGFFACLSFCYFQYDLVTQDNQTLNWCLTIKPKLKLHSVFVAQTVSEWRMTNLIMKAEVFSLELCDESTSVNTTVQFCSLISVNTIIFTHSNKYSFYGKRQKRKKNRTVRNFKKNKTTMIQDSNKAQSSHWWDWNDALFPDSSLTWSQGKIFTIFDLQ